jgi:hypothetical protein
MNVGSDGPPYQARATLFVSRARMMRGTWREPAIPRFLLARGAGSRIRKIRVTATRQGSSVS